MGRSKGAAPASGAGGALLLKQLSNRAAARKPL